MTSLVIPGAFIIWSAKNGQARYSLDEQPWHTDKLVLNCIVGGPAAWHCKTAAEVNRLESIAIHHVAIGDALTPQEIDLLHFDEIKKRHALSPNELAVISRVHRSQ